MSKLIIEDNLVPFFKSKQRVLDGAMERMAKDIKQVTKVTIPLKTGDLQKSIRNEKRGFLKHRVIVDSDYAGYQERGRRKDGSHVVKKYTTPGTGAHSLETSGDKVSSNALNYLKQANNSIRL